jgi:hypothetical protein
VKAVGNPVLVCGLMFLKPLLATSMTTSRVPISDVQDPSSFKLHL